jgi:hypothetical protein
VALEPVGEREALDGAVPCGAGVALAVLEQRGDGFGQRLR